MLEQHGTVFPMHILEPAERFASSQCWKSWGKGWRWQVLGTQYHDVIVPPYHCAITVIVISREASIKHFYTDFQPDWTCLIASPFMLCHDAVFGSLGWPLTGGQIFVRTVPNTHLQLPTADKRGRERQR